MCAEKSWDLIVCPLLCPFLGVLHTHSYVHIKEGNDIKLMVAALPGEETSMQGLHVACLRLYGSVSISDCMVVLAFQIVWCC